MGDRVSRRRGGSGVRAALGFPGESGWTACASVNVPWHVRDMVPQWDDKQLEAARLLCQLRLATVDTLEHLPLPSIVLFRAVMQHATTKCLVVLLQSGCRSEWLPTLAVAEGRYDCYLDAVKYGCPIAGHTLLAAACQRNDVLVSTVCHDFRQALISGSLFLSPQSSEVAAYGVLYQVIMEGNMACFQTFFQVNPFPLISHDGLCQHAMRAAAKLGQLEFLQAAEECAPCPRTSAYMKDGVHCGACRPFGILFCRWPALDLEMSSCGMDLRQGIMLRSSLPASGYFALCTC